jgi:tetratricopeptide (TPR) repeat protein
MTLCHSYGGAGPGGANEWVRWGQAAVAAAPANAATHNSLGSGLCDGTGDYDAAIACFRKAIELDPTYAQAHYNLGNALRGQGKVDEAIASYRKAIELDPKTALPHHNLGIALYRKGQVNEAIVCLKKAIDLDPKDAQIHVNLGNALRGQGEVDAAFACFTRALEIDPRLPLAHNGLGAFLCDVKRDYDGAAACFRKAIDLDPKDATAHFNLGNALAGKGQVDEAIACYRKAIQVNPQDAFAHINLGHALASQGRFAESLAVYKRVHELGTKQPGWRYPSAEWVRQAEAKAAMEAKLPAFREGRFRPSDNKERLSLLGICQARKLHHTAAGLYAATFAADPKLADDLRGGHRYNAACEAALAAAGQGEDAAKLDDKEQIRLRMQALDWLRADLALLSKQLETGKPVDRAAVQQALRHWQEDSDLAALRDREALAKLAAREQMAFAQLWADVAELSKQAETPGKKGGN